MTRRKIMRTISIIVNVLLLFMGSVVLLITSHTETSLTMEMTISTGIFTFVTALLLFMFFIIEFVAMLRISDSTFHTAVLALFLFVFALFSFDIYPFYDLVGIPRIEGACQAGQFLSFIGLEISTIVYLRYDYCKKGKKLPLYPLLIVAAICIALYFILFTKQTRIIAELLFIVAVVLYYIFIQVRSYIAKSDNVTFLFTSAILFSCTGIEIANALYNAHLLKYAPGLSVAHLWICILCFLSVYLAFFIRTDRKACRAEDYKLQNERLKMKVLIEQIKPHFIFNALTAIKSHYHSDLEAGDTALDLFSEYMRKSLSLIDTEVIPFGVELENIAYYIDFINTMRGDPFQLIYNIDVTDFNVPAFSLQPFIENAVKYSKVNHKEDGYIMISSAEDGDFIELKISDNGVGFDISSLKEGAHGINNSIERFKLLFGADVKIDSKISVGTEIVIRLKRKSEEAL